MQTTTALLTANILNQFSEVFALQAIPFFHFRIPLNRVSFADAALHLIVFNRLADLAERKAIHPILILALPKLHLVVVDVAILCVRLVKWSRRIA